MIINTLYGTFSVVSGGQDKDRLRIKSPKKETLMRMFDEKRITQYESADYPFYVEMCKQEFVQTLIVLVKDINYPEFYIELEKTEIFKNKIFA
jgi:hypothetical protein